MSFDQPSQSPKKPETTVVVSREKHPKLWKLIDEGNRKKLADDSPELLLLAEEIREYLHGHSDSEFEYYEESSQIKDKLEKLKEYIHDFFTHPDQRGARKIGDFFW